MIQDIDEIKFVQDPYNRHKAVGMQLQGDHGEFNNSVSLTKKFKEEVSYDKLFKTQWWTRPRNGLRKTLYLNYESKKTSIDRVKIPKD